jgi:alcohol dehydrogenase class IV
MNVTGTWNYPTPTRFGPGRLAELPDACRELGMSRPLVVTDGGLADHAITQRTLGVLTDAGLGAAVSGAATPNPVGADVEAGVQAYRDGDHDGVVAFGGGSALDVAKCVALMVGQDRPLWDFEDAGDNWTRVNVDAMAPCVAVPTTSGTGSEVGRASVITNPDEQRKIIIFHARMLPARVVCDPELTVGLPAPITAGTGMDALAHNLEALCAPGFHPQADGIALEGLRLVNLGLRRAFADGADVEARSWMMAASLMGATAFQKGLGAIHALSHPVGARLHTHHGTTNAVFTPYVLLRNRPAIEDRMDRLGAYLGLGGGFDAVLDWVLKLREDLGIPHTAAELGVPEDLVGTIAAEAVADPTAGTNPIPLTEADYAELLRASMAGTL